MVNLNGFIQTSKYFDVKFQKRYLKELLAYCGCKSNTDFCFCKCFEILFLKFFTKGWFYEYCTWKIIYIQTNLTVVRKVNRELSTLIGSSACHDISIVSLYYLPA